MLVRTAVVSRAFRVSVLAVVVSKALAVLNKVVRQPFGQAEVVNLPYGYVLLARRPEQALRPSMGPIRVRTKMTKKK